MKTNVALVYSFDSLYETVQKTVWLMVLLGESKSRLALFLARDLWEQFPALFPTFAGELAANITEPRDACRRLAVALEEVSGGWDLWTRACDIAEAWDLSLRAYGLDAQGRPLNAA